MEENKDITEKCTTDHDNNIIKPFPNTPGTRQEGASADSTVKEPPNPTFKMPRAATIPENDASFIPQNYNFSQYKLVVPKFTGTKSIIMAGRKKKKSRMLVQYEKVATTEGY